MIAKHISGRTDDACAKRYREALDPSIKQGEWTPEEDQRLLHEYRRWGGRWASVAQQLGRSGLGCRNRWRLLERKKAHTSRSRSSSSSNHEDQEEGGLLDIDTATKTEAYETVQQQQSALNIDPSSSTQWTDVFTHLQTQPLPRDPSLPSASQSQFDMNIPIDPSLASFFDNPGQSSAQFDARIWDIMNGGCGCGCGTSNMGCGCAEDSVPPFMDIPTMDFLTPFQQLSSSQSLPFPPTTLDVDGLSPATPSFPTISFHSQPVETGGSTDVSQPLEPLPSGFTNVSQYNHSTTAPSVSPIRNSDVTISTFSFSMTPTQSQPSTSLPKPNRTLSPRTMAMYRDLPPSFANIDPVKFAAAIALARAKDSQQTTCRCTGTCCAPGEGHGNVTEKATKKSCCGPSLNINEDASSSMVVSKKRSRSQSGSSAAPLLVSSCCSSLDVEPGPSKKRPKPSSSSLAPPDIAISANSKGKAPLVPRLSSNLEAVPSDSTLLPYACGDPACWRDDRDIRARFRTSGELLDHWRKEHEGIDANAKGGVSDGKVFRCALEGCGKGWKVRNVICLF